MRRRLSTLSLLIVLAAFAAHPAMAVVNMAP